MKKILLIDDSDTYIWNLRKYLQRRGFSVKTASSAGCHPRGNAAGGLL